MTPCAGTRGNQYKAPTPYTFDLAVQDRKFRRIDLIVCGVDGQQRSFDLLQCRGWVIVARSLELVQQVVCIKAGQIVLDQCIEKPVCICQRGRLLLPL